MIRRPSERAAGPGENLLTPRCQGFSKTETLQLIKDASYASSITSSHARLSLVPTVKFGKSGPILTVTPGMSCISWYATCVTLRHTVGKPGKKFGDGLMTIYANAKVGRVPTNSINMSMNAALRMATLSPHISRYMHSWPLVQETS